MGEETRKKFKASIEELNSPNMMARSLKQKSTYGYKSATNIREVGSRRHWIVPLYSNAS